MKLTLYGHCGMPIPITEGDREHCQERAVSLLRRLKREGFYISVRKPGREWETTEPDDAFMVPDYAGILSLEH